MRLIDADELLEKFEKAKEGAGFKDTIFLCMVQSIIDTMPSIKIEEEGS